MNGQADSNRWFYKVWSGVLLGLMVLFILNIFLMVASVAVNSFVFKQPVFVGDVVSFYAKLTHTGRTSITVDVQVYAQRNPGKLITVKVTEASLTYVAVGPDRRPCELPPE